MHIYNYDDLRSQAATEAIMRTIKEYNNIIFEELPDEEAFPVWLKTIRVARENMTEIEQLTLEAIEDTKHEVEAADKRRSGAAQQQDVSANPARPESPAPKTARKDEKPGGTDKAKALEEKIQKEQCFNFVFFPHVKNP